MMRVAVLCTGLVWRRCRVWKCDTRTGTALVLPQVRQERRLRVWPRWRDDMLRSLVPGIDPRLHLNNPGGRAWHPQPVEPAMHVQILASTNDSVVMQF